MNELVFRKRTLPENEIHLSLQGGDFFFETSQPQLEPFAKKLFEILKLSKNIAPFLGKFYLPSKERALWLGAKIKSLLPNGVELFLPFSLQDKTKWHELGQDLLKLGFNSLILAPFANQTAWVEEEALAADWDQLQEEFKKLGILLSSDFFTLKPSLDQKGYVDAVLEQIQEVKGVVYLASDEEVLFQQKAFKELYLEGLSEVRWAFELSEGLLKEFKNSFLKCPVDVALVINPGGVEKGGCLFFPPPIQEIEMLHQKLPLQFGAFIAKSYALPIKPCLLEGSLWVSNVAMMLSLDPKTLWECYLQAYLPKVKEKTYPYLRFQEEIYRALLEAKDKKHIEALSQLIEGEESEHFKAWVFEERSLTPSFSAPKTPSAWFSRSAKGLERLVYPNLLSNHTELMDAGFFR